MYVNGVDAKTTTLNSWILKKNRNFVGWALVEHFPKKFEKLAIFDIFVSIKAAHSFIGLKHCLTVFFLQNDSL